MFVKFSAGYYLGRCTVLPADGDHATMQAVDYERTRSTYYNGSGPLVMRLDTVHFPVYGDESVPAGAIALPEHILNKTRISHPPKEREVLLTKADRAERYIE